MPKSRSLEQLAQRLRDKYNAKPNAYIDRLLDPSNPLPIADCYLHLALIEEKEKKETEERQYSNQSKKKEKDGDELQRIYFLHNYERIQKTTRKIEVSDLFSKAKQHLNNANNNNNKIGQKVYIEGAAGSGKTTLSRYVTCQWAQKKSPWIPFRFVFHIPLRNLTAVAYPEGKAELKDILESECFCFGHSNNLSKEEWAALEEFMKTNPNQILFILDGFDELQIETNYIGAVWKSIINSEYNILFTSRPGMEKHRLNIDLNLAVLGFNDYQVKKYIESFFKYIPVKDPLSQTLPAENAATACYEALSKNPNLWSLAHTPIQLEILCELWKKEKNNFKWEELSLSELYNLTIQVFAKRFKRMQLEQEHNDQSKTKTAFVSAEEEHNALEHEHESLFDYMEALAFYGMTNKVIIFDEKRYVDVYRSCNLNLKKEERDLFHKKLRKMGLVKIDEYMEFIHLTFQEFFAARYLVKKIRLFCERKLQSNAEDDLLKFIAINKWDHFYEVMWWFVAGLLSNDLENLQTFFDLLLQEPRLELGYQEAQELVVLGKCLDEAGMPEIMQKEAIIVRLGYWYEFYYGNEKRCNFLYSALKNVENCLEISSRLIKNKKINNFLFLILRDKNATRKKDVVDSLNNFNLLSNEMILELHEGDVKNINFDSMMLSKLLHKNEAAVMEVVLKILRAYKIFSRDYEPIISLNYLVIANLNKITEEIKLIFIDILRNNEDFLMKASAAYVLIRHGVIREIELGLYDKDLGIKFAIIAGLAPKVFFYKGDEEFAALLQDLLNNPEVDLYGGFKKNLDTELPVLLPDQLKNSEFLSLLCSILFSPWQVFDKRNEDLETYFIRSAAVELLVEFNSMAEKIFIILLRALSFFGFLIGNNFYSITDKYLISKLIQVCIHALEVVALDPHYLENAELVMEQLFVVLKDNNSEWKIEETCGFYLVIILEKFLNHNNKVMVDKFFWHLSTLNYSVMEVVVSALKKLCFTNEYLVERLRILTKTNISVTLKIIIAELFIELNLDIQAGNLIIQSALSDENPLAIVVVQRLKGDIKNKEILTVFLLKILRNSNNEDVKVNAIKAFVKLNCAISGVFSELISILKNETTESIFAEAAMALMFFKQPLGREKLLEVFMSFHKRKLDRNVLDNAVARILHYLDFPIEEIISELFVLFEKGRDFVPEILNSLVRLKHGVRKIYSSAILIFINNVEMRNDVAKILSEATNLSNILDPEFLLEILSKSNDIRDLCLFTLLEYEITPTMIELFYQRINLFANYSLLVKNLYQSSMPRIPPSRLICSANDEIKLDEKGNLKTLKICGRLMPNIIQDGKENLLREDCCTLAIVRKKPAPNKRQSFFNGLLDHVFLVVEGVEKGVRFALKVDLRALPTTNNRNNSSETKEQRIIIEITQIKDFPRLQNLAENCECRVKSFTKEKAQELLKIINQDIKAAEEGEIIYKMLGDVDNSLKTKKSKREHSCISWCLEKWAQVGLPPIKNKKWYDAIAVIPTAYLPDSQNKSECSVM